jgi:hypothetical protein
MVYMCIYGGVLNLPWFAPQSNCSQIHTDRSVEEMPVNLLCPESPNHPAFHFN